MDRIKKAKNVNLAILITVITICVISFFVKTSIVINDLSAEVTFKTVFLNRTCIYCYIAIIGSLLFYRIVDVFILIPEIMLAKISDDEIHKKYVLYGKLKEEDFDLIDEKGHELDADTGKVQNRRH